MATGERVTRPFPVPGRCFPLPSGAARQHWWCNTLNLGPAALPPVASRFLPLPPGVSVMALPPVAYRCLPLPTVACRCLPLLLPTIAYRCRPAVSRLLDHYWGPHWDSCLDPCLQLIVGSVAKFVFASLL